MRPPAYLKACDDIQERIRHYETIAQKHGANRELAFCLVILQEIENLKINVDMKKNVGYTKNGR